MKKTFHVCREWVVDNEPISELQLEDAQKWVGEQKYKKYDWVRFLLPTLTDIYGILEENWGDGDDLRKFIKGRCVWSRAEDGEGNPIFVDFSTKHTGVNPTGVFVRIATPKSCGDEE